MKVTLWEGFLYLTSGSETVEGVAKDKDLPELGIELGTPGSKPSSRSNRPSFHPIIRVMDYNLGHGL